ncbi:kinase-like domain-containing protein [Catenaria anguillulae PL171]|uniref:Kinase-like domain-containing protein n=1 Tax=Catenaria anguillulae PL171 TaxID=765915 RepID=A0A1Y2HSK4_9FUNG|nr:kinase-like domain-containing protein [Catenaria anguillulae PL171]
MYHPNERRRAGQLRYRRLLLQAGASDLKSRYIYKQQDSSDALDVSGTGEVGPKSPTRSTRSRRSNSSSRPEVAATSGAASSRRSRSRTRSPSPSKAGGSPSMLTVGGGGAPKKRRPSGGSLLESPTSSSSSIPPLPPSPGGSVTSGGQESATTSWLRAHLPRTYGFFERFSPVDERDNWLAGSRRASSMSDLDRELGRGPGWSSRRCRRFQIASRMRRYEYEDEEYGDGEDEETDLGDNLTYHLDELIGQGAMGLVYRGTIKPPPPAHAVTIAVKHLHLPSANPHLNRKNFGKLIAAMSLADHPNVLTYFGSHIFDEDCFLFMEYCDGGTLSDWIKSNGPLHDLDRLRRWIRQLVSALDFLASHGIVHRDVKPANIMLVRDTLKITDFSSSKIHGMCCRKIHDARVVGTPSYMAPEIVGGNQTMEIRGAQDIWSLGCVIYEMLLAKPPFTEVDNVWSLYFILGNYARINIPPTPHNLVFVDSSTSSQATARAIPRLRHPHPSLRLHCRHPPRPRRQPIRLRHRSLSADQSISWCPTKAKPLKAGLARCWVTDSPCLAARNTDTRRAMQWSWKVLHQRGW